MQCPSCKHSVNETSNDRTKYLRCSNCGWHVEEHISPKSGQCEHYMQKSNCPICSKK